MLLVVIRHRIMSIGMFLLRNTIWIGWIRMIIIIPTHTIIHITILIPIFHILFRSTIHMTSTILTILIMVTIIADGDTNSTYANQER